MHVRSVGFNGPRDQLVHQPNDRGLAREILEPLGVFFGWRGIGNHLVEHRLGVNAFSLFGIKPIEGCFEFDRDRDRDRDRASECGGDSAAGKGVERIGHRQNRALTIVGDRQGTRPAQKLRPATAR